MKENAHLPPGKDEPLLGRGHTGLLLYFLLDAGDLCDGHARQVRHGTDRSAQAHLVIGVDVQLDLHKEKGRLVSGEALKEEMCAPPLSLSVSGRALA